MKKMLPTASFAMAALLISASPAMAAILTYTSSGPVQPKENVQFNDNLATDPFTALTNKGTSVTFTSNESLQSFSGGQARISGSDGNINSLTFFLTDPLKAMTAVEFLITDPNGRTHTTATVSFFDQFNVATTISDFALGNGNDWFAAKVTGNSVISKVVITTAANVEDVRQIRVSPAVVPEPATWAMLIAGFGMIGAAMRRRNRPLAIA